MKKIKIKNNIKTIKYIILTIIEVLFLIYFGYSLFKPQEKIPNKPIIITNKNESNNIFYYINIYCFYESPNEDLLVKGFYETKVELCDTIRFKDGDSLANALQTNGFALARINKVYKYDNDILKKIEIENNKTREAVICLNSANNIEDESKCTVDYYFTDDIEKYDLYISYHSNMNILLDKSAKDDW